MAPYVLSMIALTLLARKAAYPKALLYHFAEGSVINRLWHQAGLKEVTT